MLSSVSYSGASLLHKSSTVAVSNASVGRLRRHFSSSSARNSGAADYGRDVVIVAAKRTPIGTFNGELASVSAPELAAATIKSCLSGAKIPPNLVDEVIMGNVLSAGMGQAPARQAAKLAELPDKTICTTINKVCSSGMKAITVAAQTIALGQADIIVAGGMESMSQVPFYSAGTRKGVGYGHQMLEDGILKDGLTDVYNKFHMGMCGEDTASKYGISREKQDEFAIESYKRAQAAWKDGKFKAEVCPVTVKSRKKEVVVCEDSECMKVNFDKLPQLKPAFKKEGGTITAANASSLNDGASAVVLMSLEKAEKLGIRPMARIRGYADAEKAPIDFPTAPAAAVPKALAHAGVERDDIQTWEFNEAFSVVGVINQKILGLDPAKVNPKGGAVALGHPIGSSGCRIVVTLLHTLKEEGSVGSLGCAAICNGGGGATALVVERF
eukprot:Nk52_evm45s2579 gene=Nk52_evmTU45s2579